MRRVPIATMMTALFGASIAGAHEDPAQNEQAREVKLHAESFELILPDDADNRPPRSAQISSEPLLVYSDPARVLQQSGLWLWNDRGRPVALLAIEFYPRHVQAGQLQPDVWTFEATRLTSTLVAGSADSPR